MPPFILAQLMLDAFASLRINICQEDIRSLSGHLDRDASPDVSSGPSNENVFPIQQLVQCFLQRQLLTLIAFGIQANFVDGCSRRDVQRTKVGVAPSAVRRYLARQNSSQVLSILIKHPDTAGSRTIDVALNIQLHPIRRARSHGIQFSEHLSSGEASV